MTAKQIAAALLAAHPTAQKITPTGDPMGSRLDWIVQVHASILVGPRCIVNETLPASSLQQARLVQREFNTLRLAAIRAQRAA